MSDSERSLTGSEIFVFGDRNEEIGMIANTLVGQGYKVTSGSDYNAAVKIISENQPGLIVLAVSPEATGRVTDIYRVMGEKEAAEEISALLICDASTSLDDLSGLPGTRDILRRPYERYDLIARVKLLWQLKEAEKEAEKLRFQLVKAQKMECLGALASGVAHEFNNLMFCVMGFAELARTDDSDNIEALKESADISYETAQRAVSVARSLLAFSRQSRSEKEIGNLNEAAKAAVRLLKADLDKSGIKTELQLGDLPETLFAFGPIQQVFLNLIINSWHAMVDTDSEKKLLVKTEKTPEGKLRMSVTDTGRGISDADQKKIFEPFYTTKGSDGLEERQGSGLGLVIVKEVIKDHNGIIRVESGEGSGTTFLIELPVQTEKEVALGEGSVSIKGCPSRRLSVLVVDDEESNRTILNRILVKCGHKTYLAANPAEAAGLLWGNDIDLITMDLIMAGRDGVAAIKELREQGIETPILVCTGCCEEKTIDAAMAAGANEIVKKPFSSSEFVSKVEKCVTSAG